MDPLPSLTTHRLVLRPVAASDLDFLMELNSDPEVMAHILGRPATGSETSAEWERRLGMQSNPLLGLGYWLGLEQGEPVGWWSASWYSPDPQTAGVGYRLRRSAWGRGLATEGAAAMVAQAFRVRDVERVAASTMAINTGSRRVLEKVGMRHTKTWVEGWEDPIPGSEHGEVEYELLRNDWRPPGVSGTAGST